MTRDISQRTGLLRIVPQTPGHTDCGICALASLIGHSYEQVLVAVSRSTRKNVLVSGCSDPELFAAAKKLGSELRRIPWERVDHDEATGMLHVKGRFNGEAYEDHMVIYRRGDVIDLRDPSVWDADVYLKHYAADAITLYIEA